MLVVAGEKPALSCSTQRDQTRFHLAERGFGRFVRIVPLPGAGTVYVGCKFIDDWGILTVDGALLAAPDLGSVCVPAPETAAQLHGRGWKLELNAGWKLVPGARAGDFTIGRE